MTDDEGRLAEVELERKALRRWLTEAEERIADLEAQVVARSPSRDGSVAAYERANERLEVALLHIINRISTEGRDDEHKHLFLVGSEAVKHARAEVENLPSRDGNK